MSTQDAVVVCAVILTIGMACIATHSAAPLMLLGFLVFLLLA